MQLDLTSLSVPELRSLLDSARDRGQAAQSYQILQEMARRREGGAKPRGRRRPAEPRIIELDLGDPLDRRDEDDLLAMPDPPAAEPDADPLAGLTLADPWPAPPPKRPHARRGPPGVVVFAAGASVGVAAGVALALWTGVGASQALTPAAPAPVEVAAVQPPAALTPAVAELAPSSALPVETVAPAAPQPDRLDVVLASPDAGDAAEDAGATAETSEPPAAEPDACASGPTAADRVICGDPALQRLQKELREAYAEALDAHADRALLRQRQLAWRDARSGVGDPDRLAGLYEQRIRKLAAATADAKRQRP